MENLSARADCPAFISPLGAQIWVEHDDSAERVDFLCARAAESGLGWIRIFLMWPWIERAPQRWDFGVFDHVFAAAQKHGLKIKATLTANSGPAWLGTPGILHSHTGFLAPEQRDPMQRYVAACVARYGKHPALGQWILWNEPSGGGERTPETLARWRQFLRSRYQADIAALNHRWLTAYADFGEIPFWNEVAHPLHRGSGWFAYRATLDDAVFRADWLVHEIQWLAECVRTGDPRTPLCINPTLILANQAEGGTDLEKLGSLCEVVGASYHPSWHFTGFAQRPDYPALMAAGVRHCAAHASVRSVEVTEVQMGNTLQSSHRPNCVHPGELLRFVLAGLGAGATTVTGWCFNIRRQDNEAGDWAVLDDRDAPSPRSRALRRLRDVLATSAPLTGAWSAAPTDVWLPMDPRAQALEMAEAPGQTPFTGRRPNDSIYGQALLAQRLSEQGYVPTIARFADLPAAPRRPGEVMLVSHVVAWEQPEAERLLAWAEAGGVLVIDGSCGRKNFDARQHTLWPGFLGERIGLTAVGHESRHTHYDLHGGGRWGIARLGADLAPSVGWSAWPELRFAVDGEAAVWERPWGRGRICIARGLLGPSLIDFTDNDAATRAILARATAALVPSLRPVSGQRGLISLPITCERGTLVAVLASETTEGGPRPLRLQGAPGRSWRDFWSHETLTTDVTGELALTAPDGVALLWTEN